MSGAFLAARSVAERPSPAMTSSATWSGASFFLKQNGVRFMDAAAQGGGTPAGTGKVITQGLFVAGLVPHNEDAQAMIVHFRNHLRLKMM